MTDSSLSALLAMIYDMERSRGFGRLKRELERYYRQIDNRSYKKAAYIDSMLALLLEEDVEQVVQSARQ